MTPRSKSRGRLAVLLAALVVCGCGSLSTLFGPGLSFGGRSEIEFAEIPADLNHDTPVAVDLVIIYDKKLAATLAGLTAAEWFATRAQLKKDHADAFDLYEWQWMPGQSGAKFGYEYRVGAACAIVFADYFGGGDFRQVLSPAPELLVRLRSNDFVVESDR